MPCAIASQMEVKKPFNPSKCDKADGKGKDCEGDRSFIVGGKEAYFKDNIKTNNKYLDLLITNSGLKCKRCVPTGYKCKLLKDSIIQGQPGTEGNYVDSYFFTDDKTLETGLLPRMIDSVGRVMTSIDIDNALNVKKKEAICRPYVVDINTDEDGQQIPVWCNITDETIKDNDFDINSFSDGRSRLLAFNVRNNNAKGQQDLREYNLKVTIPNNTPPKDFEGEYYQDNKFGGKIKFVHKTNSNYMIRWINTSNKDTIDWHDGHIWVTDAWYITKLVFVGTEPQGLFSKKNIYKTQIIAYNSTEVEDYILGKIPDKDNWTYQGNNPPSPTISVEKQFKVKESFQNRKGNKLNPQNLTFDDDIPMKVYYGLLGVGGIYLLYQLSKKYNNKLNLD